MELHMPPSDARLNRISSQEPTTHLAGIFQDRARRNPTQSIVWLDESLSEVDSLTVADLDQQARAIAVELSKHVSPGDCALLVYSPGLEFLQAFVGCLYAGVIAVPTYPPRGSRGMSRVESLANDSQAKIVLSAGQSDLVPSTNSQTRVCEQIPWLFTDEVQSLNAANFVAPSLSGDSIAFLQYTSGSTGSPKGVMVTHANLIHNLSTIREQFDITPDDTVLSWLPSYHDMGLIGGILTAIFAECPLYLMAPTTFMQSPMRWLKAIDRYGVTLTGGPNFAYDLCVERATEADLQDLDLSRWAVAFNGAEPIVADTLQRFSEKFAPCGFRHSAWMPCYGMAETTLLIANTPRSAPPTVSPGAQASVSSGLVNSNFDIRIVDPDTGVEVAEGEEGEIWVTGDSVARGYWNRNEETVATFHNRLAPPPSPSSLPSPSSPPCSAATAPLSIPSSSANYLRTGDLGRCSQGQIFVTGRIKDLIIIRGRNLYPQDIERAVGECDSSLTPNGVIVFSVTEDTGEALVVVAERRREARSADLEVLMDKIQETVAEQFQVPAKATVIIRSATLPRTTSGKVTRRECRSMFLSGQLRELASRTLMREAAFRCDDQNRREPRELVAQPELRSPGVIERWLQVEIARHLKTVDAAAIDPEAPFVRYGLDSATAVLLSGQLSDFLNQQLSPTLFYDCPTIRSVAEKFGHEVSVRSLPSADADQPIEADRTTAESQDTRRLAQDAIAVVAMGCRLPSADSPDEYWRLLKEGRTATGPIPPSRWTPDTNYPGSQYAGLIDNVDQFAASFFGIAPREAVSMDPQHRVLLEVTWQALEQGGFSADQLRGQEIGVFVGISSHDYSHLLAQHADCIGAYAGTGNAASMAAHRLSFHFNWKGPSLAIDTACSSSLAAIHQACQSIRLGECKMAVVAGVNLMLTPTISNAFAQAQMLSPTGACHSFDAAADGYVRSEGCAAVVLKPLDQAIADEDTILAVVRGSAINQDGLSNGITAPNSDSQEDLLRKAMKAARVDRAEITYVEAHGTGTPLGDPIELNALKSTLSGAEGTCHLGTVKANLGHLEAAAGIAGFCKVVLALKHAKIPPHPTFRRPNPHASLAGNRLQIATQLIDWRPANGKRIAGVTSLGFGGTNVHVILEEPPQRASLALDQSVPRILTLSGKTESELAVLTDQFAKEVRSGSAVDLATICNTTNAGRAHHRHRIAVVAKDCEQTAQSLDQAAGGQWSSLAMGGSVRLNRPPRIAFLFSGQGSQYPQMAAGLYRQLPEFRRHFDRVDQMMERHLGSSMANMLFAGDGQDSTIDAVHETRFTQPAMFCVQHALAATLADWGIHPTVVAGHSLGEISAACWAGCFSLEDGVQLIATRATLCEQIPDTGRMAVVFAPYHAVQQAIVQLNGRAVDSLSIAAINGPENVVVSGRSDMVDRLLLLLESGGFSTRPLPISRAIHSPLTDSVLETFERSIANLDFRAPTVPMVTNVTGELVESQILSANHWRRHLRQPVRFSDGMRTVMEQNVDLCLEIGPGSTVINMGRICALADAEATTSRMSATSTNGQQPTEDAIPAVAWLPLLSQYDDMASLMSAVGQLYVRGVNLDWASFNRSFTKRRCTLPTYPFARERYWLTLDPSGPGISQHAMGSLKVAHSGPSIGPPSLFDTLGSNADIAAHVSPLAQHVWQAERLDRYESLDEGCQQLATAYFMAALRQLNWEPQRAIPFDTDDVMRLGIVPKYRRLVDRVLQMGVEDGWLRRHDVTSQWSLVKQPAPIATTQLCQQLLRQYPECESQVMLAEACGRSLPEILTGQVDALEVLFADENLSKIAALYDESPTARFLNRVVTWAVDAVAANRPLRILEIGGGTGGTTTHLLKHGLPDGSSYTFTDISPAFVQQAADRFAAYPGIEFHALDISQDPAAQGFPCQHYDLVLAANVLHATPDIRKAVRNVAKLLRPEGYLVLLEGTEPHRYLDLIFGLTDGWWSFSDTELRPAYPLLSGRDWDRVLISEQLVDMTSLPDASLQGRLPQSVLLARNANAPMADVGQHGTLVGLSADRAEGSSPPMVATTREHLAGLGRADQESILAEELSRQLASILGSQLHPLDFSIPLNHMGLDSLMAMQLRNRVEHSYGVKISMVRFMQGMTLAQLQAEIIEAIPTTEEEAEDKEKSADQGSNTPELTPLLQEPQLGDLSDEQIEQLLTALGGER